MAKLKKHANWGRGLLILAIAAFFGYRYFELGRNLHLIYTLTLGLLGLLSLINRLPARWQTVTMNLAISLFFLDFVFAEINLWEVGYVLTNADLGLLLLSMLMIWIHVYFRTLRWQWLLKPMGQVKFWPACRALLIGITGNAVLPARAGEFLRAYVLGRSTGLSKTGIFATIVVERIFDGLTVLMLLLLVIVLGVHNEVLQMAGLLAGGLYLGALAALVVFMVKRHWADAIINKLLPAALADKVLGLLDGFTSGLAILKDPKALGMVLFYDVLLWAMIPISSWFALASLGFGVPIPWQAPVLLLPAMALGLTIPGAPGGVGVVQAAIKLTLELTMAGLPVAANFAEKVAAAAIVIHFTQFAPEVIPGIFMFMYEGISTHDINVGAELAQPEPQTAANFTD
jgi:hypothetical protein